MIEIDKYCEGCEYKDNPEIPLLNGKCQLSETYHCAWLRGGNAWREFFKVVATELKLYEIADFLKKVLK